MTNHTLRIVVEKVNTKTGEIVEKNTISSCKITAPKNIMDLGLRHTEQINILQRIQDHWLFRNLRGALNFYFYSI